MMGCFQRSDSESSEKEKVLFGFHPLDDPNLWAIQEFTVDEKSERVWTKVYGYMLVYVDDILWVDQGLS